MNENKDYLLKGAMAYGMSFGIFWVIKYLFFILSLQVAFLGVVYWGMTATGPYLAYILTKKYKQVIGGKISFFHALQFGILIYFFAALIISLVHYIFYQYIAPADYIENSYKKSIEMMVAINMDSAIIEAVRNMGTPSNISMTIQGIFNNTMYGIVFSIPVAAIVCRGYNSSESPKQENTDNTIE
ncbi:MAG: DUF4199 domain-containing protein [Parabacteroides sp.]|jgi:hypothetical protein|nr:DUF4199 domain-containing protein [Parabacteroides sp.]MBP8759364.1 DUF4199 domain-containing protein [Parabacteroides sp.]MBP9479972.1 DUF4199 domain-containing protein [Parabacteroides sp.]MBP9579138.1 DUF4199 domain-containing protein [Parabacteroides sp.]MDD2415783.1 DUF4199 domain-containing protein [Parabacteroides sp.]